MNKLQVGNLELWIHSHILKCSYDAPFWSYMLPPRPNKYNR
jgi:hypothetical protein